MIGRKPRGALVGSCIPRHEMHRTLTFHRVVRMVVCIPYIVWLAYAVLLHDAKNHTIFTQKILRECDAHGFELQMQAFFPTYAHGR